ncbi:MAG: hypothetical protein WD738_10835 [Pirellulales bacterium]
MAAEWFCRIMGDEWGPMSAMELVAVARWGRLTRDDTVRCGTKGTWVRAELVRGLFNTAQVAATVTSGRVVIDARRARPAKRSVRKIVPTQYWVRVDEKIAGPFSSRELRQMAEQGALKPFHWISKDRERWARAALVKGLSFGGANADAATMSVRSAVWLDEPIASPDSPTADYAEAAALSFR